jgi:hypothetical protein
MSDPKKEKDKADEGLDYLDKKQKKRVWWWLFMWFIMPFTAFMKLEKLLSSEDDPKEYSEEEQNWKEP